MFKLKYFEMFAGIGGFRVGIEQATEKWECIGYSEIDKYASAIYEYRYPGDRNFGDATNINVSELPDFDLLVGGFPCQSFSIAGKKKGFNDSRGTLFFEIARILKHKRPGYFLLENVKGLLSHDNGKTFSRILGILANIGYEYQWQVLDSRCISVPQSRERIFIFGYFGKRCEQKIFPFSERNQNDRKQGSIYRRNHISRAITAQYGKVSGHSTKIKINGKIRIFTPIECERLQAFPDNWTKYGILNNKKTLISDSQRYKTIGNAVTTSVISAIIKKLDNQ